MNYRVIAIAYETVTQSMEGREILPLLRSMSAMAGRLSVLMGAHALEIASGGKGVLLGGLPKLGSRSLDPVGAGRVVILGGGTVGRHAAHVAGSLGADVVTTTPRYYVM